MKTPLLLLHGALGSSAQFTPLCNALPQYDCLRFDFEGHGTEQGKEFYGSTPERPFRIEHFAENLRAFIEANNLAPARIVGYSMGGYVAMYLAAQQPQYIHSIITLGTKLAWTVEGAEKEVRFLDANTIAAKVPAYAKELEERHTALGWRAVLEKTAEMMRDLGKTPRLNNELFATLQCPVRIGVGDRDTMVSLEESLTAYKAIPGAEFYVLPGTQHPLERVLPARWARMIDDFFVA